MIGNISVEEMIKTQKERNAQIIEKTEKIEELEHTLKRVINESTEKIKKLQNKKYDLSHLIQESQIVYGPIQDDEALFLTGLVKALRPKTVVEFGFSGGVSSFNFLQALDLDSKLYSYDIHLYNPAAKAFNDSRFKFHLKSQTDFEFSDIDNRTIDIAFFDDGHIFEINKEAFIKLEDKMSLNSVTVVHDTGLHIEKIEPFEQCVCDAKEYCGAAHQLDERLFINWIIDNYTNWQIIQLHSFNIFRHGFTIMQKKYKLGVDVQDRGYCNA